MANPFNEWENIRAFAGAANNKTGSLSTAAVNVCLTTPGWWGITASVDYHVRGPDAATTAVTTADHHEWARDYFFVKTDNANEYVSLKRSGSVSGTYWIGKIKGA